MKIERPIRCERCDARSVSRSKNTGIWVVLQWIWPSVRCRCQRCKHEFRALLSWHRPAAIGIVVAVITFHFFPVQVFTPPPVKKLDQLKTVVSLNETQQEIEEEEKAAQNANLLAQESLLVTIQEKPNNLKSNRTSSEEAGVQKEQGGQVAATRDLMDMNPNRYTIQLASSFSWREADQMMVILAEKYGLNEPFFVYRSMQKETPLFPLLYGDFATFESAEQQILTLPEGIKQKKPFVRKFGTIQNHLVLKS